MEWLESWGFIGVSGSAKRFSFLLVLMLLVMAALGDALVRQKWQMDRVFVGHAVHERHISHCNSSMLASSPASSLV
jgi:hypothetical protein